MSELKYFDKTNINEAKLFKFGLFNHDTIKEVWEKYLESEEEFDGLEIPIRLNWHNGKDYKNINNYFKINIIAIKQRQWNHYLLYGFGPSMTDLKEGYYGFFKKELGQLLYSQNEVTNNEIISFDPRDCFILKSFRPSKSKRNEKKMEELVIVGVKVIAYDKFPYNKYIDVLGPKETFFI